MDRSLMEYFEIFVVNLYQSKLMTEKDYEIYKELYLDMIMQTGHP